MKRLPAYLWERFGAALVLLLVGVILAAIAIGLSGCKSPASVAREAVSGIYENAGTVSLKEAMTPGGPYFFKFGQPKLVQVDTQKREAEQRQVWESEREAERRKAADNTWGTFRRISPALIVPGAMILAASFLPVVSMLRRPGYALLGVGIGLAVAPWVLSKFGPVLLWPAVILGAVALALGVWTVGYRVVIGTSLKRRCDHVEHKLEVAKAEGDEKAIAMHTGALVALRRANDPSYEKRREWEDPPPATVDGVTA